MAQTKEGIKKAVATIKAKYGEDFYKNVGRSGGIKKNPMKGFGGNRELARKAGRIGGRISKRQKND